MEGEHTPTIIQLIQSTDLAIIQLKDSLSYSSIPTETKTLSQKVMKGRTLRGELFYIDYNRIQEKYYT